MFETYNAGSVKTVEVLNANSSWETAWETKAVQQIRRKQTLSIKLKVSSCLILGRMDIHHASDLVNVSCKNGPLLA